MALILLVVDSMSLMFWGSMATLVIDRVGQKQLMLRGVVGNSICFALVAVELLYGGVDNKDLSTLAVVFNSVYYVFYGISLLSIPYMYPDEINSQTMRKIGTSITTTVNWVFVYVVVVVTPTTIENIHWKYYMLYVIFNDSFIPIIWVLYVGNDKLSLEQVDQFFEIKQDADKDITRSDATRNPRTEIPVGLGVDAGKLGAEAAHCEVID